MHNNCLSQTKGTQAVDAEHNCHLTQRAAISCIQAILHATVMLCTTIVSRPDAYMGRKERNVGVMHSFKSCQYAMKAARQSN